MTTEQLTLISSADKRWLKSSRSGSNLVGLFLEFCNSGSVLGILSEVVVYYTEKYRVNTTDGRVKL